jgi:hypothetical protein
VVDKDTGELVREFVKQARAESYCTQQNKRAGRDRYCVDKTQLPKDNYYAPRLEELLANQDIAHLWDPNAHWSDSFGKIPEWVWDERIQICDWQVLDADGNVVRTYALEAKALAYVNRQDPDGRRGLRVEQAKDPRPLTDTARLVMTIYVMCGLLDYNATKCKVHPRQDLVARLTGLSVKAVYLANCEWEALSIIRVAHPAPQIGQDGRYKRGPADIIYLPERRVYEEIHAELRRFRELMAAHRNAPWHGRALRIHEQMLADSRNRELTLQAVWQKLIDGLLEAGVPVAIVRQLVPQPPE